MLGGKLAVLQALMFDCLAFDPFSLFDDGCSSAVETEIDRHYSEQLGQLEASGAAPELAEMIATFRKEEREHRDAAFANGSEQAPAYPLLAGAIRLGCRLAIKLSERI